MCFTTSTLIWIPLSTGGGTEVKLESDDEDVPTPVEHPKADSPALVVQTEKEDSEEEEEVPEIKPMTAAEEKPKLDVSQSSASAPSTVKVTNARTSSKGSNDEKVRTVNYVT